MMDTDNKIYEQLVCNAHLHNCNADNNIGDEGIKHLELPASVQSVDVAGM